MEMSDLKSFGITLAGFAFLSAVLLILQSVLGIWALDTLFSLKIPLTIETVLAGLALILVVRGEVKVSFKQKT